MKNEETNPSPGAENLERRLHQLPLKAIPAAWRNEIISAAQATSEPVHARNTPHVSRFTFHAFYQRLIWPHPKAWAALATAWAMIFLLDYSSRESAPLAKSQPRSHPTQEARQLLAEQRLMLAELIEQAPSRDAGRAKTSRTRPHSQRRQEFSIV